MITIFEPLPQQMERIVKIGLINLSFLICSERRPDCSGGETSIQKTSPILQVVTQNLEL